MGNLSGMATHDIRRLGPGDLDRAVDVLVAAFMQDPLVDALFPDPRDRRRAAPILFRSILAPEVRLGRVWGAGCIAGRIGQRVRASATIAERYRRGDLTAPSLDYGDDELGTVARALDDSVHELGSRMQDLERDRGRMAAMLSRVHTAG